MLVPRVQLIPSEEQVCDLLRETGAMREGHFEFPNGLHSNHYFQLPLAMRYHGNARVLNVALSRLLRRALGRLRRISGRARMKMW